MKIADFMSSEVTNRPKEFEASLVQQTEQASNQSAAPEDSLLQQNKQVSVMAFISSMQQVSEKVTCSTVRRIIKMLSEWITIECREYPKAGPRLSKKERKVVSPPIYQLNGNLKKRESNKM